MSRTRALLAIHCGLSGVLALAAFAPACGSSGPDSSPDGGDGNGPDCIPFVAFASDFANYQSWTHFHLDAEKNPFPLAPAGDAMPDLVHTGGTRDVYINLGQPGVPACVTQNATEFPIGTIIIKVMSQTGQTVKGVFAQVKRGCGYNLGGADNWEWFDLITDQNGLDAGEPPQIIWEGETPPANQSYGGDPTECNTCHSAMGSGNDSIISTALDLETLACKPGQQP
jgi:hypothetical protein